MFTTIIRVFTWYFTKKLFNFIKNNFEVLTYLYSILENRATYGVLLNVGFSEKWSCVSGSARRQRIFIRDFFSSYYRYLLIVFLLYSENLQVEFKFPAWPFFKLPNSSRHLKIFTKNPFSTNLHQISLSVFAWSNQFWYD